jgi:hypothetical protein
MRPEQPECQCLACAQLQHHQANDTLLLVTIGTIAVIGGLGGCPAFRGTSVAARR